MLVKRWPQTQTRQVSCKTNSARPIKRKCSAGGGAGRGDSCRVSGAGKPARLILAAWAEGRGSGLPAGRQLKGYGDARYAPARQGWAGAAGAQRDSHITQSCGGSRGPADPWSAAAASKRRDLWFFQSADYHSKCNTKNKKATHKRIL